MSNVPREVLCEIVTKYDRKAWQDADRCRGLLMDLCADRGNYQEYEKYIIILVEAIKEHAVKDLQPSAAQILPLEARINRLIARLTSKGYDQQLAQWSIETWAIVLKLIQSGTATYTSDIHTVSAQGRGQYKTIVAAIAAAEEGDTILIRPGTYEETIVVDKLIKLVGDGAREEIILTNRDQSTISMQTDTARIENVTLQGMAATRTVGRRQYGVVDIRRGNLELSYCMITAQSGIGIMISGPNATAKIEQCLVHDSTESGILLEDRSSATIDHCEIFDHRRFGISIRAQAYPVIRSCKVRTSRGAGIQITDNGLGEILSCEIFENGNAGIEIKQGGNPRIEHCTIHSNRGSGLLVWMDGQGRIEQSDIFKNHICGIQIKNRGIPIIQNCRVYHNLGAGMHVQDNGRGQIEDCDIHANTLCGIAIHKGGDPTIIKSRIHNEKGSGLQIYEQGHGTIKECEIFENTRIGIEIKSESNSTIEDCKIRFMGKVGVTVEESNALIKHCQIDSNTTAGLHILCNGDPIVTHCDIKNNRGPGTIFDRSSMGTVEHCDISQNTGAGIDIKSQGNPSVYDCRIHHQVGHALKIAQEALGTIKECDLTQNSFGPILASDGHTVRFASDNHGVRFERNIL